MVARPLTVPPFTAVPVKMTSTVKEYVDWGLRTEAKEISPSGVIANSPTNAARGKGTV